MVIGEGNRGCALRKERICCSCYPIVYVKGVSLLKKWSVGIAHFVKKSAFSIGNGVARKDKEPHYLNWR